MKRAPFLLFLGALTLACPKDPVQKEAEQWVVKVGTQNISDASLVLYWSQRHIFEIQDEEKKVRLAEKTAYHLGVDEALLQRAYAEGIQVTEEEIKREVRQLSQGFSRSKFKDVLHQENWTLKNFEEQIKRRLAIKKHFQKKTETLKPVTEEEIRDYYDNQFLSSVPHEEVRAQHILVDTKEEAAYIREKLFGVNAILFEVAARRFSKAPEDSRGGELDWFGRGDLPSVFDVCFHLKANNVSQVIESDYGFHLIKVLERRKGKAESFEHKREHIEKLLRQLKEEKLIKEERKALAEEIKIHIHADNLRKRLMEFQKEISTKAPHEPTTAPETKHPHAH